MLSKREVVSHKGPLPFHLEGKIVSVLKASVQNIGLEPRSLNEFHSGLSLPVGSSTIGYLQTELGTEQKGGGN